MSARPIHTVGVFSVLFLAGLFLAGCSGQRSAPPGMGVERSSEITVFVDNLEFNDARIYMSVGGSRGQRLGSVDGKTQQRFTREWRLPSIAFEIDLLGGRTFRTFEVAVSPGEVLDLRIQAGNVRLIPRGR